MNFEDLKTIWNEESTRPSYTIDEETLERLVVKRESVFRKEMLRRDALEIGVAVILVIFFLIRDVQTATETEGLFSLLAVSHFLMMIGVAVVGLVIYIGRQRQKVQERGDGESIQENLQKLISNLSYQIRLLSNVAWWYLSPIVPGVVLFVVATADASPIPLWPRVAIIALVFGFALWLNRRVVRKHLMPQKRELQSFLSRLEKHDDQ